MASKLALTVNGRAAELEIEQGEGEIRVCLGDRWHSAQLERTNQSGLYSLVIDGRSYEIFARERPGGLEVLLGNRVYAIDVGRPRADDAEPEVAGAWTLAAPMSGQVTEVRVAAGDSVTAGQVLLVIESMKMNNELTAARAGEVVEVGVGAGERVEKGRVLVRVT